MSDDQIRVVLADVAEQGTEYQLRHSPALPRNAKR